MDLPGIRLYAAMATIHRLNHSRLYTINALHNTKTLHIQKALATRRCLYASVLLYVCQSLLAYSSILLYGNRTVNVVFTWGSLVAVTVPWCKLITLFTKYRPSRYRD